MFARIVDILSVYKRGQGVWTRIAAALSMLAMGTYGAVQTGIWMVDYQHTSMWAVWGMQIPYYYGIGTYLPVFIFLVFMVLAYVASNTTRAADLLIETEIEMRKVTWPTTREVLGATVVVIVVVLILGLYLWSIDTLFQYTFLRWLGLTATG